MIAELPELGTGEFYLATDTGQLYVGINGVNFKVGTIVVASVQISGNANPTHYIEPNADGSLVIECPGGVTPAQDGTDATGVIGFTGSVGIRGWLSSLYAFFGNVAAGGKQVLGNSILSVQQPKDCGRTYITLYVDRIAGVTTEALVNMSINKGGIVTTGTSYTVTTGKTFRIQSVNAEILNTTTTANRVLIRVRSAATVTVGSPVIAMAMSAAQAALAASGNTDTHNFPDGIEIAGGQQVGFSQLCSVTTAGVVSATIVGYEY